MAIYWTKLERRCRRRRIRIADFCHLLAGRPCTDLEKRF